MKLEYDQRVEFEESQISLDIPYPEGITKDNGVWRIIPTSPSVVRNPNYCQCYPEFMLNTCIILGIFLRQYHSYVLSTYCVVAIDTEGGR